MRDGKKTVSKDSEGAKARETREVSPPVDSVDEGELVSQDGPPSREGEAVSQDGPPSREGADLDEGRAEGGGAEDPAAALQEEVDVLQEDLLRLQDQHLRLAADFENYRKRVSSELTTGWVRAQAELAGALLDGLDDLQRVSRFTSEDATLDALIEGVDLVERKFMKALVEAGLKALDPVGEPFDPNLMEAVMRVPVEADGQDETVHQVFQRGYLFKDQLSRPARVSVHKDDD